MVNDDYSFPADVLIENGKIKRIEQDLEVADARVINAAGLLVIPGGIDPRTNFEAAFLGTRSVDDFYHGTRSAIAGGTTMILDCVVAETDESLVDAFAKRRTLADAKVCCDYALCVSLATWNDRVAEEMDLIVRDKGANSFVLSLADVDLSDADLFHCLARCRELGVLLQVHAEDRNFLKEKEKEVISAGIFGPEGHLLSRPEECESEAVFRTIVAAKEAGAPVYVTKVTSCSAADIISKARKRGDVVFSETTAAALGTNGFHVFNTSWRHAAGHVTSPPLRADLSTAGHLMDLLASGDLQTTASDNRTFNVEQKALGKDDFRKIPSGVNGVEDRMSVVWEKGVMTGKVDFCRFVAITSSSAAKIFNLYPQKGRVAVGSDADLVVWDPNTERRISCQTHRQNCDFNVFEGLLCHGAPVYVITSGRVALDPDGLHVTQGSGRYVPLPCNSQEVYGRIRERLKCRKLSPVERDPYVATPTSEAAKSPPSGDDNSNPITTDKTFHLSSNDDQDKDSAGPDDDRSRSKRPVGYRVNQPPGGKTSQLW